LSEAPILTAVVRRDRWIVAGVLALACALAWAWLFAQARPMSAMASMPGMGSTAGMAAAAVTPAHVASAFVMWALMMVAMMLPSAAPMILTYARFAGGTKAQGAALAPTLLFAAVYVAVWAGFSAIAAATQAGLVETGAISATRLALGDRRIAGALLVAAGLYQLTPIKRACLGQCQTPLGFIMQRWRPGWRGALRLGFAHALVCVGCCWALMALLFVAGVMNLLWIAGLAIVALAERVLPGGAAVSRVVGVLLLLAGVVVLVRG